MGIVGTESEEDGDESEYGEEPQDGHLVDIIGDEEDGDESEPYVEVVRSHAEGSHPADIVGRQLQEDLKFDKVNSYDEDLPLDTSTEGSEVDEVQPKRVELQHVLRKARRQHTADEVKKAGRKERAKSAKMNAVKTKDRATRKAREEIKDWTR